MFRNRKLLIGIVVAAVLLIGSLASVAVLAADEDSSELTLSNLWDKVAQIYEDNTGTAIDAGDLQTAVTQAQDELRSDALKTRLDELVAEGQITQEQADAWLEWQAERPDMPLGSGFGEGFGGGCRGGMRLGGMGMMRGFGPLSDS